MSLDMDMEESAFVAGIFLVEAVAAFTILPRVVKYRSAVKESGRTLCEQCGLIATKSADPLTEQKIWKMFYASLSDFFRYMIMVIFSILLLRCFSYQLRWLASPEQIPGRHRVEDAPTLVMLCFTLLYLNFGCLSSPCLLNVLSGVLMAFTVTLSNNYSRTMASRLLIGITTRDYGFVVLYNLICTGVDVHVAFMTSEDGEEGASAAIFSEAFYQIVLVLAGTFAIRTQIWARAQRGVSLKNSELELAALYRILGGLCDAVVMLDDSLQLTEDSAALSTLFLRGCSSTDLAGNDFVSCFRSQDRDHVRQRLSSATIYAGQPALALNAGLQDSAGNCINVELLHLPFERTEGCIRHVVGIREFHQDVAAVGPLIMADLPSSTLGGFDSDYESDDGLFLPRRRSFLPRVPQADSFISLQVADCYFTQESVSCRFRHGINAGDFLSDVIVNVRAGVIQPNDMGLTVCWAVLHLQQPNALCAEACGCQRGKSKALEPAQQLPFAHLLRKECSDALE
ncbi:EIF4E2 [Symbiodinium sp. CCMP2592]|nr:EIF4E2 [Symbiodinium sp. CCMP2592]